MYHFSKWKLTLILAVLIFSVLYLLPTPTKFYDPLYGHLPLWMQERLPEISATDENSLRINLNQSDEEVRLPKGISFNDAVKQLSEILRTQLGNFDMIENTDYQFDTTENREFLVKFTAEKSQIELQKLIGDLNLYGSMPIVLRRLIPAERLKLGLDLKGGVHIVLEVDEKSSQKSLLKNRADAIPSLMRSEKIRCREVEASENTIIVPIFIPSNLINSAIEKEEYLNTAKKVLSDMQYFGDPKILRESDNKVEYEVRLDQGGSSEYEKQSIDQVLTVLRNRVDAFGVAEPSIRRDPNNPRVIVELPGAKDSSGPLKIVKTMGRLEFKLVAKDQSGGIAWTGSANQPKPNDLPDDQKVYEDYETGGWYVLKDETLLTGDRVTDAYPTTGQLGIDLVVSLSFDGQGRRKFAEVTTDNVGRLLAIVLDGKVQSAPRINEPIPSGSAQISGDFSLDEATYLANILKSGAFPVDVQIAEERTVGPTLGQESIDNGIKAGIIGMAVVLIFMAIYYKMSGMIAVIALAFNMLIILAALAGFGAALTLPGIAGLVLTIGMSVDANVLIFERIREELRTGKTIWSAIESGYQRAFWTILDANLTTLAVALVLYNFGTGPIKGFAVTLGIGILASMFTAIIVTRELYGWIIGDRRLEKLSI